MQLIYFETVRDSQPNRSEEAATMSQFSSWRLSSRRLAYAHAPRPDPQGVDRGAGREEGCATVGAAKG